MIKSMTGFASLTHEDAHATIAVTVRTVNHRFLDMQIRMPQSLGDLEARVRTILQKRLARGRVEIGISVQLRAPTAPAVELNLEFVDALAAAVEQARARGVVSGPLTPGDLLRLPQALRVGERAAAIDPETEAQLAVSVESAVEEALADLDAMRVREGDHLRADLEHRRQLLAGGIEQLQGAADRGRAGLEERLRERIHDLSAALPVDQAMLAQEVVRVAGRSDITEEVTRFRAHLAHWGALTDGREPCGRKLDFLLQEMNREINTIGSKADGIDIAELIITAKAELEKMREQVQNVESDARGLLFIVSAPSGTGKTTLVERLVQMLPRLHMSRSYTSRRARAGEQDGVDYNFITAERFLAMVDDGAFIEWADVFGNYYGTCAADIDAVLACGDDVVLVIDVQGARQVRNRGLENVGIFVLPPSAPVLEQRLRGRSKDSEEQVRRRLETASQEVGEFATYEYIVVNDSVEEAASRLQAIVLAERAKVKRMRAPAEAILATFPEACAKAD